MKKHFILLSLLVLVFSANVFAKKTAKQIFMSLPNDYVSGTAKQRAMFLTFPKSIKPDFLTFMMTEEDVPKMLAGDFKQPQAIGDLRVFRGKTSTIAALRYQVGDGKEANPTTDTTKIITVLLENKAGKWTDVTDSMMPKVSVDDAYKVLTENFQINVKKEDVWVETQVGKDKSGLQTVARIKGNDSVTTLKWFKWTGKDFVEAVY
jgi:hypothetical protein